MLNTICLRPAQIEVQESTLWKNKDLSKVKDYKNLEAKFDWSFSSPYRGSIRSLSRSTKDYQSLSEVEKLEAFKELDVQSRIVDEELGSPIEGLREKVQQLVGEEIDIS